jgi:hypothetical protein
LISAGALQCIGQQSFFVFVEGHPGVIRLGFRCVRRARVAERVFELPYVAPLGMPRRHDLRPACQPACLAIVKVLEKLLLRNQLRDIPIACRDYAHVHFARRHRAKARHFLILEIGFVEGRERQVAAADTALEIMRAPRLKLLHMPYAAGVTGIHR